MRYYNDGFFRKYNQLYFDTRSEQLLKEQLFSNSSVGDKLRATNYDIHTRKIFGLAGQLHVFFAALISASLPVTGFLMWRNKRKIL